ncbi:MAG: hypothetical protein H8E82_05960 [Candidatus Marinimicrobia bacterium]|nr:hypothetical protein [Candidatus Neomarinimicrobiota bacterium]
MKIKVAQGDSPERPSLNPLLVKEGKQTCPAYDGEGDGLKIRLSVRRRKRLSISREPDRQ